MDAVEFFKAYRRLCSNFSIGRYDDCDKCPLRNTNMCGSMNHCDYDRMIPIVEEWAKYNPAKTRQSEFLKIYPNAIMDVNGIVSIDPCLLDSSLQDTCDGELCPNCRKKYWNEEVLDGNSSNV